MFPFDNSYARLPEHFFARLPPTPVSEPALIRLNESLALHLGLDLERLITPEAIEVFAGNRLPEGAEPLAMAYAGFQFGSWVPQLGDGRAILLGELIDRDGVRRDVQLKGAGPTPFSRNGDGRVERFYRAGLQQKLGLSETREGDAALAQDLLKRMTENAADFTLTFRRLSDVVDPSLKNDEWVSSLFEDPAAFDEWAVRWRNRLAGETRSSAERRNEMRSVSPAFIPRNHRVEEAIQAAVEERDLDPFEQLIAVSSSPFDDQPSREQYAVPPRPDQIVRQTFCGT